MNDKARIAELEAQVASLEAKVALLLAELSKRKLSKDSSNSHNPPSQDKYKNKARQSLRKKSMRKSGGQPGHKGHTLEMVSEPTHDHELRSAYCQGCGTDLVDQKHHLVSRRQVVDIPPIVPVYTQYSQYGCHCPTCNHHQKTPYPEGVNAPIQYGTGIEALVSYLNVFQYIPYKRMKLFFRDVLGLDLSQGSIENILTRSAQKMDFVYQEIKNQIEQADSVGSDETGAKVDGEKWWIWVWQNVQNTFLNASESRGSKAVDEVFPKGLPNAILGSDRWPAQLKMVSQGNQLCLAHLLRDLIWIEQSEKSDWATQFIAALREGIGLNKKATIRQEAYQIDAPEALGLENKLNQLLACTILKEESPEAYKFQRSMIKNRNSLLTFLYHLNVPPDNNGSERAIRNLKVKQKVFGQFKTGQQRFCVIRSVVDTLVKRGLDLMAVIKQILNGNQYQYY